MSEVQRDQIQPESLVLRYPGWSCSSASGIYPDGPHDQAG